MLTLLLGGHERLDHIPHLLLLPRHELAHLPQLLHLRVFRQLGGLLRLHLCPPRLLGSPLRLRGKLHTLLCPYPSDLTSLTPAANAANASRGAPSFLRLRQLRR